MKRLLSKSSVNIYLQCPLKWKYFYIDEIPSISSPQQERGSNIHKKIENFYKDIQSTKSLDLESYLELKNFINFELSRIKNIIKERKSVSKYFYPLFQELKIENEKLGLKGIIDAVYIHPKDDKLIIIDWKTGQYNKNDLNNYRLELAIYKELLEKSDKIENAEIGYWGVYFTDADKLFFEKIDEKYISEMYDIVDIVKRNIDMSNFRPKKNWYCKSCQFWEKCKNDI